MQPNHLFSPYFLINPYVQLTVWGQVKKLITCCLSYLVKPIRQKLSSFVYQRIFASSLYLFMV